MKTLSIQPKHVHMEIIRGALQEDVVPALVHNPFQRAVDDAVTWSLSLTQTDGRAMDENCLTDETPQQTVTATTSAKALQRMIELLRS